VIVQNFEKTRFPFLIMDWCPCQRLGLEIHTQT